MRQLLLGVCNQNNKSQPSQKSKWHKGIGLIRCKLARMSFGYFAGPQTIKSSTTSHVPSSSAQLLTVVVTSRRDLPALPKLYHTATISFFFILQYCLLSAQWIFMEYLYTLRKNQVSSSTVRETMCFSRIVIGRARRQSVLLIRVRWIYEPLLPSPRRSGITSTPALSLSK